MKATYNATAKTKFTTSHRKEGKCFFSSMQVIDLAAKPYNGTTAHAVIEARLYGTGSKNYAALWVHLPQSKKYPDGLHTSGTGSAGGYGYHRPSAALAEAIRNAGFTLDQDIGGRGESLMRESLLAIAAALGIKRPALLEAHQ
jgi:hypothetical protein